MTGWAYLFNTWEADRIVHSVRCGDGSILTEIRNQVIPRIDAYCRDIDKPGSFVIDELKAAAELRQVCERVIQFDDETMWPCPVEAAWKDWKFGEPAVRHDLAESLERAWLVFISEGAGPLVYIKQPAERRARAKGAIAKAQNKRGLIEEVIRCFDPGTGTKKSRVATIIKKAEEAKVEGREKLPIRLDKYLP
jgi:hypothetical protein